MELLIFFYFFNFLKSFEIDLILTPELSREEIKWAKEYTNQSLFQNVDDLELRIMMIREMTDFELQSKRE